MEQTALGINDFYSDKPIKTVGTAIARWQVQPDNTQSDWGHHRQQARDGKHSLFQCDPNEKNVPDWDRDEKQILAAAAELNPEAQKSTFRFSIDISEVCPEKGVFDEQAMMKYIRTLARCHFLNLEPMVTLNHWTMPKTFAKLDSDGNIKNGPLEHPDIVKHFKFFVNKVTDFLCDPEKIKAAIKDEEYPKEFVDKLCDARLICKWFITLNEPFNMILTPYIFRAFPPHQKNQWSKYDMLVEKLRAMHRDMHEVLHKKTHQAQVPIDEKNIQVGMTHTLFDTNDLYVPGFEEFVNWGLVEKMQEGSPNEFMGIQYYCRIRLWDILARTGLVEKSDPALYCDHLDFATIDPEGVYRVFKQAQEKFPHQNLMMSEFGAADKKDQRRPYWILESLRHLIRAKQEGVNIQGVLLWSLIDNWEWMRGMNSPFGLYDYRGQRFAHDKIDNPQNPSSRLVWKEATSHLMAPTAQKRKKLIDLRATAKRQFDTYCEAA